MNLSITPLLYNFNYYLDHYSDLENDTIGFMIRYDKDTLYRQDIEMNNIINHNEPWTVCKCPADTAIYPLQTCTISSSAHKINSIQIWPQHL